MEEKLFTAEYTEEAKQEFINLDKQNKKRVLRTVNFFELFGKDAVTSRPLDTKGLFELKCGQIRIYFKYCDEKLIIIGLITLKKTEKAPTRYKEDAHARIERYLKGKDSKK